MAKLLDIGNLVLVQQDRQRVTWESFDYPTNTMLPFMKLGQDQRTGLDWFLTSWKSKDDPRIGNYSYRMVPTGYSQLSLYMGRTLLWHAGSWTGLRWSGVPKMTSNYFKINFVNNQDEVTIMYGNTLLLLLSLLLVCPICTSLDTITPDQPLKDGQHLLSNQETFALGFFNPGSSSHRYVGIWFNQITEKTVVWVANRGAPLNDTSGVLSINGKGNLVLHTQNQTTPIWSTNVSFSVSSTNNSMAKLLDIGNLVLVQQDSQRVTWQSFDYPTNTLLPFMKLGLDQRTGLNRFLTSWKSKDDPGIGSYSFRMVPTGYPQLSLYMGQTVLFRLGCWTGLTWSNVPIFDSNYFKVSFVNNQDETTYMYSILSNLPSKVIVKMMVDESGIVRRSLWQETTWVDYWSAPRELCDKYSNCGQNSYCDPHNKVIIDCKCFPGFEPKSSRDCMREKQGVSMCNNGEGFVKLAHMNVPDTSIAHVDMSLSMKECEQKCLRNCSCMAYASANESEGGIGCLTWQGDLVDTRTFPDGGQDLYIRVDAVVLAQYAKKNGHTQKKRMLAILGVSVAIMFLLIVSIVYCFVMKKKKETRHSTYLDSANSTLPYFEDSPSRRDLDGIRRNSNLPLFNLRTIIAATDNFSIANKLGQGGFGPVYKVWDLWREDNSMKVVDPLLDETYPTNEVSRCIQIGLLCVQEHAIDRPTMSTVVFMLGNDTPLPSPKQPAFILKGTYTSTNRSTSPASNSINEITHSTIDGR
nr:g-type lectin s-receptor-like serine/threonine-protein kinase rks1 [Quercus suber]